MRRLAGSRLGAVVSLSLVLSMGTATGLSSSVAATPAVTQQSAGSAVTKAIDEPDVKVRRLNAARAKDARRVELPRPVRGVTAIRLLGHQLDEAAALNDLSEADLVELLSSDPTAWLDHDGFVFFKDEPAIAPAVDPVSAEAPLDQTFLLHSKPGSTRTIYLDFDGGTASGTAWHANYPATPNTQPGWDPSGNGATFDNAELTKIQTVWQSVAEDYAPFDVDVTTADPGAAGILRTSAADQSFGSHVLITPSDAAHDAICGGCGGVAYISVFDIINGNGGGAAGDGYGYMQPAWVFPQKLGHSPKNIAEAVSHEVGHNFGLNHDGNATQGYDTGHGSWAPIMGVGYDHPISQWSKGDYTGANNTEDDVAKIGAVTGARVDEAGTSIAAAPVVPAGTAYVSSRTDVDTYLLGTCTGSVTVNASVDPFANLDAKLSILDAAGQLVASADPASAQTNVSVATGMNSSLTQTLASGTYYASIDGVGNGTPITGYDDYGSIGSYSLAVTGCNGAAPTGTPSAPTNAVATPHASDPTATITWAAPASAGSSAVTKYVLTRSGSDTPVEVGPTTTSYAWTGLANSTSYSFTVTALNVQGPGPSVTVNATTAAGTVLPGAPTNVTASWASLQQQGVLGYAPPASSGSYAITGYDIFVNTSNIGRVTFTPVGINGLTPGTWSLGVAAVTQAGRGPVSYVSLVVPPRPANDAFAQRTTLSGVSGTIAGDNLESSAEVGEPVPTATRVNAGGASLWYSWTAPASGPATLTTTSSVTDRDTTLNVYTGTSVAGLTAVAGNDEPGGASHLAAVSFTATAGTTYAIAVNGYRTFATGVGAFSLAWSGTAPPPAAVTTTTLGSVVSGRSATLTANVTATSGNPVGNVQFHDGAVLVGTQAVSSGTASVTVSDLVKGDHPYQATFVPTNSGLFTTSQSSIVTSTIAGTSTTTTLTATSGVNTVNLSAAVTVSAGTATGTVEFREGPTTVGSAAVSAGNAALALTGVTAGQHTYIATFVPADVQRYDGSVSTGKTVTVEAPPVAKATTTGLTASPSGRSVNLTATVTVTATSGTPAGSVQFRDGDTVVATGTLAAGTASATVNDLLRGTHHFTAEFVPTDPAAYVASQSSDSVVEIAATPTTTSLSTSVSGRTVTLTTSVSPTVAGTVHLHEGATLVGTVTLAAGAGQLTLSNVPAGDHTYTASFVPADDLRHAPSTSTPKTQTVLATPTTTALGSSVSNHQVTLTATVTSGAGSPAGSVEFREGTTVVGTSAVSVGIATLVLDDVATGGHAYTATFVPSAPTSYAGSVSSVHNATVVATVTTTDLSASASGRTVTLTATPSTASGTLTGSVEFREGAAVVGTVPLGAGSTVLVLTSVNPGNHGYTATFVPSGTSHAASTSALRTTTVQVSSTTALTATALGRDVTLDATVATDGGAPAGTVEFRDGSTLLDTKPVSGGAASLSLTNVNPGDHTYTATFVPTNTAFYTGSTSPARPVNVAQVATSTALTASATGQTVTLTATPTTGSGTLVGTVEFHEGATLVGTVALAAGTAVRTLTDVAPGDHTYTATFVPTGTFHSGSTSPSSAVTVAKIATSTALTASVAGRAVTLTATPTTGSGTLTGSVEFREGTTLLATVELTAGKAVLTLDDVAPGEHTYEARFVPTDLNRFAGSSSEQAVQVGRVATTTTLTSSVDERTVTLTAAVTTGEDSLVGEVRFHDEHDNLVATEPLTNGTAVATFEHVYPGDYGYTATFVPTGSFHAGSTSPVRTVTVSDADVTTTTALEASAVGRTVTLEATVTSLEGTPEGMIEFRDGGELVGATAFFTTNGQVDWEFENVPAGTHHYTATFVPDPGMFAPSSSPTRTIVIAKTGTTTTLVAETSGDDVTLTATLASQSGSLVPPGMIEFREGENLLETWALGWGGTEAVTQLDRVLGGSHTYTATYVPDNGDFAASSGNDTVVVDKTSTTVGLTASKNGRRVTLTSAIGSPIGSPAGTVSFLDGEVVVDTVTVSGGTATRVLNDVHSGTHDYTATFTPTQDTRYVGSTSVVRPVTLTPSTTTTTLTAAAGANSVNIDVHVNSLDGVPSGVVTITEEGIPVELGTGTVSAGRAVFTIPNVRVGTHKYTANYGYTAAGSQFAPSASSEMTVQVSNVAPAAATSTELTAVATRRTVALQAVVSKASGTVTPSGSVQFREDGIAIDLVPLTNGTAVLSRSAVASGVHNYTATYVPNTVAFASSVSPAKSVTVQRTVTSTNLTGSVNGSTVALDIAVAGTDGIVPTGHVRVLAGSTEVGNVQLAGGTATLILSSVGVGTTAYRAVFDGSADLAESTSSPVELTVAAPPTTAPPTNSTPPPTSVPPLAVASSTTKVVAPRKAKAGSRPVIKVTVLRGTAPAPGKVVVTVGKKKTTLTLRAGTAKLKLPTLRQGKLKITVRYLGDATTTASSATWTINVTPAQR